MKRIRGLARLRLQPTDDLLGRKTFGTAVLSHPPSPNIMEHDLQPQCGPSQHAAAPRRPCPDSQVWTDISARIPANLAGPAVPEHRGPTEAVASCVLAWSTSTTTHQKWCDFKGRGVSERPRLTPQGRRKALTRKVRVGDAATRPLSRLQGDRYANESPARFQPKLEAARSVGDLYGLSAQSQGDKGHCSTDLQQPVSLSSSPGEWGVMGGDRKFHVFLLAVIWTSEHFTWDGNWRKMHLVCTEKANKFFLLLLLIVTANKYFY